MAMLCIMTVGNTIKDDVGPSIYLYQDNQNQRGGGGGGLLYYHNGIRI